MKVYEKRINIYLYKSNPCVSVNQLFRIIMELFAAGTETTGTSLDWAFLYMIINPKIQQKCYEEIKQVIHVWKAWFDFMKCISDILTCNTGILGKKIILNFLFYIHIFK